MASFDSKNKNKNKKALVGIAITKERKIKIKVLKTICIALNNFTFLARVVALMKNSFESSSSSVETMF